MNLLMRGLAGSKIEVTRVEEIPKLVEDVSR